MGFCSDSARAVCPYYLRENKRHIVCEGVVENSEMHIRFAAIADKKYWQEKICNHHGFMRCPLASAAAMKYEEI